MAKREFVPRDQVFNIRYVWIYEIYTAISRKVVVKTVHATLPKGKMGYDQYTCSWHCSCRTYFYCFFLALANILPWPLVPFFEIYLKSSELKTTHNTFRDCRVHFFRQPFSKQLYISVLNAYVSLLITWKIHWRKKTLHTYKKHDK